MEHLTEDNNLRVKDDCDLFGTPLKAGHKMLIVSKQGSYNGLKMRVPPPEFEALMFFSALDSAAKAEVLKKMVVVGKSAFDNMPEVEISDANKNNFFLTCQNSMAAVVFSVGAIESWANKSIELHGVIEGVPKELVVRRKNKPETTILANLVASNPNINLRIKLFQLIPQIFSIEPLKEHSSIRDNVSCLVEERNAVMHMQSKLNISESEFDRVSYAIKLFKVNSFLAPETVLQYLSYVYSKSKIEPVLWFEVAKKELNNLKKAR